MEIIYRNETEEEREKQVEMPKNFRQIGNPAGKSKLYIEDYVSTYLKQLQKEAAYGTDSAVLLGKIKSTEQGICVFVSAAVPVEKSGGEEKKTSDASITPCFREEDLTQVYQVMKEYFTDIQIVGWVQMVSTLQMQITPKIAKTHRQFFPGRGKVFWMQNLIDREEKVYLYQKGELNELHGYYIYYEKNPQMQEYMVRQKEKDKKNLPKEMVDDMAAKTYRQRMAQTKTGTKRQGVQFVLYAASAGVMAAVCILGVSLLNNYESMQQMQNAIAAMGSSLTDSGDGAQDAVDGGLSADTADGGAQAAAADAADGGAQAADGEAQVAAADAADGGAQAAAADAANNGSSAQAADGGAAADASQNGTVADASQSGAGGAVADASQSGTGGAVTDASQSGIGTAENGGQSAQNGGAAEVLEGTGTMKTSSGAGSKSNGETGLEKEEGEDNGPAGAESAADSANTEDTGAQTAQDADGAAAQAVPSSAVSQADGVQDALDRGYYIVQAGENLETICRRLYQTTAMVDKLCEANNIEDCDKIYAGQKLVLP